MSLRRLPVLLLHRVSCTHLQHRRSRPLQRIARAAFRRLRAPIHFGFCAGRAEPTGGQALRTILSLPYCCLPLRLGSPRAHHHQRGARNLLRPRANTPNAPNRAGSLVPFVTRPPHTYLPAARFDQPREEPVTVVAFLPAHLRRPTDRRATERRDASEWRRRLSGSVPWDGSCCEHWGEKCLAVAFQWVSQGEMDSTLGGRAPSGQYRSGQKNAELRSPCE